jgi:ABC-type multidrug transport system fused ATPase/permease subunit
MILIAAIVFFLTYTSRLLFLAFGKMLNFKTVQRIVLSIRLQTFRHIHHLSADYYDKTPVGDTMFRIEQDINEIANMGGEFALSFARLVILSTLILCAMMLLNFKLTLLLAPLVPVFLIFRRRYHRDLQRLSESIQSQSGQRNNFLQENISSMVQLKLLRREASQARQFAGLSRTILQGQLTRKKTELFFGTYTTLIIIFSIAVLIGYGGYLVTTATLTVGGLVAFYTYVLRVFDPFSEVVDIGTKMQRVRASARRILDLLETKSSVVEKTNAVHLAPQAPGLIEFRGVHFAYSDHGKVLDGATFQVSQGEKIALVGRTGSGKSTIAKLIARLYDVQKGIIAIGGHDVRDLQVRRLRSFVALMPQDPVIFSGSIRDNLLFGNPNADQRELEAAIHLAQFETVIRSFSRGLDESVGPRGSRLSGGERQRLALARTILQQPRVLILDEATSALDPNTERRLLDALGSFVCARITVLISHRLSAIQWADRILALDNGRVTEMQKQAMETEASFDLDKFIQDDESRDQRRPMRLQVAAEVRE